MAVPSCQTPLPRNQAAHQSNRAAAGLRRRAGAAAGAASAARQAGASAARARQRSAARREAILAAALDEFSARGFEAARLDDVARRAGIAKGTIYLYFRGKESLFQELVREMLTPVVGAIEAMGEADLPLRALADRFVDFFVREVYETRRARRHSPDDRGGPAAFPSSPSSTTARCSRASSPPCARCSRAPPRAARSRRAWSISRRSSPRPG